MNEELNAWRALRTHVRKGRASLGQIRRFELLEEKYAGSGMSWDPLDDVGARFKKKTKKQVDRHAAARALAEFDNLGRKR